MASKGTSGLGLAIAAALIVFAIFAPGAPERPTPVVTGFSGSGLLAQRAAYGAALGGQTATTQVAAVPTKEEIDKLIADYLATATAEAQAQLAALLPRYLAGAQADIQAQISSLAAQFLSRGVTPEQLLASLTGALPAGSDSAVLLSRLLAPHVKDAHSAPHAAARAPAAAPSAPRPSAPRAAPPAPPPSDFGFDADGIDSNDLKSSLDKMDSKLDNMGDMDMNMDMD